MIKKYNGIVRWSGNEGNDNGICGRAEVKNTTATKIGKLVLLNTLILGIKDNINHIDTLNRTCGIHEGLEEAQAMLRNALSKVKDEL